MSEIVRAEPFVVLPFVLVLDHFAEASGNARGLPSPPTPGTGPDGATRGGT